jgi:hypothetical protein
VTPRNPVQMKGVEYLRKSPPEAAVKDLPYAYFATQVMYHRGGEDRTFWNLGPGGKGADGLRDLLVKAQDTGAKKAFQAGSWAPAGGPRELESRVVSTALAVLSLEVYYRHAPLFRREAP